VASDAVGRAALEAWQASLAASGLPTLGSAAGGDGPPRISFAAPLAAAFQGDAELADLWLTERLPIWTVREALAGRLPSGHAWVAAEDVWLGAPPLPGQVAAAEWSVALDLPPGDGPHLEPACAELLAAAALPRSRSKGGVEKQVDLRPLLADVGPEEGPRSTARLRIVTRFDPGLGTARPEEVVAALAERVGMPVPIGAVTRRRLILADPARD
jgi:hypothetical protein